MISIWCNERHSIILLVYFFVSNQRPTNFSWNWFIPLIFHEFFLPLNCKQCHQILAHPFSYCWHICQNSTAEGRKFFFLAKLLYSCISQQNFVKCKTKFQFHEFFFLASRYIFGTRQAYSYCWCWMVWSYYMSQNTFFREITQIHEFVCFHGIFGNKSNLP